MTVRNDFTIQWYSDPRIIEVAAPATTLPIQDIHDTLASIMDSAEGAQFPGLVTSDGKSGGGVTGVVTTLQNAQIQFEPRTTKLETGTVTTPDTTGTSLIDSTALFQTNLVTRGDIVLNAADGSHATVDEVISETELKTTALMGGVDNQYDSADAFEVFDYVQTTISGGDIFAVDDVGADISPILTSFGVIGPIIEQDTSPAAAPVQGTTILEGSRTWEQAMRLILAATAGKLSGAATTTISIRDTGDSKDRIVATVDASGNRTAVTLDDS